VWASRQRYRVAAFRVYLTGESVGDYGTWALAAAHPKRFDAIAPIFGGGDPAPADRLRGAPVWAFHGADDRVRRTARNRANWWRRSRGLAATRNRPSI